MRSSLRTLCVLLGIVLAAAPALAQVATGTLTGNVSYEGVALPGVMVTVNSPNLQGTRTATTTESGDYLFRLLPPGDYTVAFTLESFRTLEIPVRISGQQAKTIDAVMYPAAVTEEIEVTGSFETISSSTQASTTVDAELIEKLPADRNIQGAVLYTPGVHSAAGLRGHISISGSQTHESLFLLNGVVVNENIRGQPVDAYIEDAIQETTTSTSGISAEYGRFAGGVVNTITKSGGNEFSGSFRLSLDNEDWEGKTPLTTSQQDEINKTYEATLGGFLWRDTIWFFLAGRDRETTGTGRTVGTNVDFPTGEGDTRYEAKLTISPTASHRLVGSYLKRDHSWTNYKFGNVVDTGDSVYDRELPEELTTANYSGVLTESFLIEGQWSERTAEWIGSGSSFTDLIRGTVIGDDITGYRGNAATFCGVCEPNLQRNNENWLVKASYFLTSSTAGSHDIVFGYDHYADIIYSDNHQSGSDWHLWVGAGFEYPGGGDWYPVVTGGDSFADYFIWWPIIYTTQGSEFAVDSIFVNDTWRLNKNWSFNLGARYDANTGKNSLKETVSDDSKISPRLGVTWDPWADGEWLFNLSYSHYVTVLPNTSNVADQSPAGAPGTFAWFYTGDPINVDCTWGVDCLAPQEVLQQVFDWFFNDYCDADGNCGTANLETLFFTRVTGVNRVVGPGTGSPYAEEFSTGVTKRLGTRGLFRADYTYRQFKDQFEIQVDTTTGKVDVSAPPIGLELGQQDLSIVRNSNYLERTYHGVNLSAQYRLSDRVSMGGNYTWSQIYGNWDGETYGSGPISSSNNPSYYPEYLDVAWSNPNGLLGLDQRHKFNGYIVWDAISTSRHNLSLSWLETYRTGTPYEATGSVRSRLYVENPGYITRPSSVNYYFTPRGAFKTDDIHSSSLAVNYSFFVPIAGADVELFIQPEVRNLFGEDGVVSVDTSVRDYRYGYEDFNPFTGTPVEGVNWDKGPDFGQPVEPADYQAPRTFMVSLGVRF